jgi:hypothetical protein
MKVRWGHSGVMRARQGQPAPFFAFVLVGALLLGVLVSPLQAGARSRGATTELRQATAFVYKQARLVFEWVTMERVLHHDYRFPSGETVIRTTRKVAKAHAYAAGLRIGETLISGLERWYDFKLLNGSIQKPKLRSTALQVYSEFLLHQRYICTRWYTQNRWRSGSYALSTRQLKRRYGNVEVTACIAGLRRLLHSSHSNLIHGVLRITTTSPSTTTTTGQTRTTGTGVSTTTTTTQPPSPTYSTGSVPPTTTTTQPLVSVTVPDVLRDRLTTALAALKADSLPFKQLTSCLTSAPIPGESYVVAQSPGGGTVESARGYSNLTPVIIYVCSG